MIKVATDCSGVGSPEQALKMLGIPHRTVFACEIDKYARQTYLANHECETMYEDITKRDNNGLEQMDLYIAGFPCQAFSKLGSRKGFADTRGTIFFNVADFISKNRPRAFILENVRGLVSHDNGRTMKRIVEVLRSLKYELHVKILNTKNFGIPQSRERVYFVGLRDKGDSFQFPYAQELKLRLGDIKERNVPEKYYLSDKMIQYIFGKHVKGDFWKMRLKSGNELASCLNTSSGRGAFNDDFLVEPTDESTGENEKMPDYDVRVKGENDISNSLTTSNGRLSFANNFITVMDDQPDDEQAHIVVNDHGTLREVDLFSCLTANDHKGVDKHGMRSLILSYSRDAKGKVTGRHTKHIANTVHGNTGTGNNTDQLIVEIAEDVSDPEFAKAIGDALHEDSQIITPGRGFNKGGTSKLCPTITASRFENNCAITEGAGKRLRLRRLTPRESFRLQNFNDDFILPVSDTQLYKQCGNAMSVNVLMAIFGEISFLKPLIAQSLHHFLANIKFEPNYRPTQYNETQKVAGIKPKP